MIDLLLPAVNTLKSYIKCAAYFQDDPSIMNSNTLNSSHNDTILSCLPISVRQDFLKTLVQFQCLTQQKKNLLSPSFSLRNLSTDQLIPLPISQWILKKDSQ